MEGILGVTSYEGILTSRYALVPPFDAIKNVRAGRYAQDEQRVPAAAQPLILSLSKDLIDPRTYVQEDSSALPQNEQRVPASAQPLILSLSKDLIDLWTSYEGILRIRSE